MIFFFTEVGSWNSNENKRRQNSKTGRNIPNALGKTRGGILCLRVLATTWTKARDLRETNSTRVVAREKIIDRCDCGKTHDIDLKFSSVAVRSWGKKRFA